MPSTSHPKRVEPTPDVIAQKVAELDSEARESLEAQAHGRPSPDSKVTVTDTSAVEGPRTHTIQGKKYTFEPNVGAEMTFEEGATFISLEGFEVATLSGVPLRSHNRTYRPDEIVHMRTDQCVATLTELTAEALLERVRKYADGNGYSLNSDRYQMVAFLIDKQNTEAQAHERDVAIAAKRKILGDDTTA